MNEQFFSLQGTASVVLAGLVAALKLVGGTLAEHTFLFLGAGEVTCSTTISSVSFSPLLLVVFFLKNITDAKLR